MSISMTSSKKLILKGSFVQIRIKINRKNAECLTFGNFNMRTLGNFNMRAHGSTAYNKVIICLRKTKVLIALSIVSKFKSLLLLQLSN